MSASSTTQFDLGRARDLVGRGQHVWNRRVALGLMTVFVGAAFVGLMGQSPVVRTASSDSFAMRVQMPERIRGGLMFPVRIEVRAKENVSSPQVVIGPGFVEGMHINTLAPAPVSETTRPPRDGNPGSLAYTYPSLEAGDVLTVYLQLQANPTTVGNQDATVSIEGPGIDPVRSRGNLHVLP